jgi:hypothetical protein
LTLGGAGVYSLHVNADPAINTNQEQQPSAE